MDGTSLEIETNTISHFFEKVGNFWEDCSKAKVPEFFEQPPISGSTADYIELDFIKYGYPAIAPNRSFRIIKRNSRPLFIPLSRKEFVEFLIASSACFILDCESAWEILKQNNRTIAMCF